MRSLTTARLKMMRTRKRFESVQSLKRWKRIVRAFEKRRLFPCPWPLSQPVRIAAGADLLSDFPGGRTAAVKEIQDDLRRDFQGHRNPGGLRFHTVFLANDLDAVVTVRRVGRRFAGFKAFIDASERRRKLPPATPAALV